MRISELSKLSLGKSELGKLGSNYVQELVKGTLEGATVSYFHQNSNFTILLRSG